jgi:hypothetical protein
MKTTTNNRPARWRRTELRTGPAIFVSPNTDRCFLLFAEIPCLLPAAHFWRELGRVRRRADAPDVARQSDPCFRALRPVAVLESSAGAGPASLAATLGACLLLTWLNPHVYLDTVVLLGSIAQTHDEQRWWFALGAASGSVLWFCALGYGARLLRPVFSRPTAWRVLDALIATVMTTLAISLAVGSA